MTPVVITPPVAEPITLAEAKVHLRVVGGDDDAYIAGLIVAARMMVEGRTGRALMPQRVRIGMDAFGDVLRLPRSPLTATPAMVVKYYDTDGVQQTLAGSVYDINTSIQPAAVTPAYGQTWPPIRGVAGGVTFEYDVGYPDADAVPAPLRQWMLLCIGTLYAHRDDVIAGVSVAALPDGFMRLLWEPYMVYE